jgi:hypothetical protein
MIDIKKIENIVTEADFRLDTNTVGSRFATVRFTAIHFTTLVESYRALLTCFVSLSQLKRPFCTYCACSCFPVCMCFFLFYFSAVLLS